MGGGGGGGSEYVSIYVDRSGMYSVTTSLEYTGGGIQQETSDGLLIPKK